MADKKAEVQRLAAELLDKVFLVWHELQMATPEEIRAAAEEMGGEFPPGYVEYMGRLGRGRLYETFDIYLPREVLQRRKQYRAYWEGVCETAEGLPEDMRELGRRCVPLGETVFDQFFAFDPGQPGTIYLVSRDGLEPFAASVCEAIEAYIAEHGMTSVRDFVPATARRRKLSLATSKRPRPRPRAVFDAVMALNLHDASSRADKGMVHLALYFKEIAGSLNFDGELGGEFFFLAGQGDSPIVQKVVECLESFDFDAEEDEPEDDQGSEVKEVEVDNRLLALFDEHAAAVYDKQKRLEDLVGGEDWEVSFDDGTISFANGACWKIQVLGTESEKSGTWLWAWGNKASAIPEPLTAASLAMKNQLGDEMSLDVFAERMFAIDDRLCGHFLATIAVGLLDAAAYYRAPYEGGAAFLLIDDPEFPKTTEPQPLLRISVVFPQVVADMPITDHQLALVGYARFYGLETESAPGQLLVRDASGATLTAQFDDSGRLTGIAHSVGE